MQDYKLDAAKASLDFITPKQKIELGAGSTIFHIIDFILKNPKLAQSLTFVSSSFKTREYLREQGLKDQLSSDMEGVEIYFDGCDQFDKELNAFKSGGGIHTNEKIIAANAKEFILVGDESKYVENLDHTFQLVVEILPDALPLVRKKIHLHYPESIVTLRVSTQKDGAVITENGNLLADIRFPAIPVLAELNTKIKMITGIVEHSLFYRMAKKAIIAGKNGIKIVEPNF